MRYVIYLRMRTEVPGIEEAVEEADGEEAATPEPVVANTATEQ